MRWAGVQQERVSRLSAQTNLNCQTARVTRCGAQQSQADARQRVCFERRDRKSCVATVFVPVGKLQNSISIASIDDNEKANDDPEDRGGRNTMCFARNLCLLYTAVTRWESEQTTLMVVVTKP